MAAPPPTSQLFIGSSSEGSEVAHTLQAVLEQRKVCQVEVWDQRIFQPSGYALPSLLEVADRSDFAVLVATPDDMVTSRDKTAAAVRDNVILEFGLFVGALGLQRTYVLLTGEATLPSDMAGLTRLAYRARPDGNLHAAVNAAALEVKQQVVRHGRRARTIDTWGDGDPHAAALGRELAVLRINAQTQGWTVKTDSPTTLRLVPPGRTVSYTLTKQGPRATRERLRTFVASLRAEGLRVNTALRLPIEDSPY